MKIHQKGRQKRKTRKTASFLPTKASKEMSSMSNITSEEGEEKNNHKRKKSKIAVWWYLRLNEEEQKFSRRWKKYNISTPKKGEREERDKKETNLNFTKMQNDQIPRIKNIGYIFIFHLNRESAFTFFFNIFFRGKWWEKDKKKSVSIATTKAKSPVIRWKIQGGGKSLWNK